MDLKEIKSELERAFGKYKFYEEGHYYECNGIKVGQSVTRLIEEYSQPFDAETIASRVAAKENKSVSEVLSEWEYKNKFACEKGNNVHSNAQSRWSGINSLFNSFDGSTRFIAVNNYIFRHIDNFYEDFKNKLIHIQDEQVIGDEDYDIASAIDHLFIDKNGSVYIIDYKSNSYMSGYNKKSYGKMRIPFQKLEDSALNHYYLQLGIYKFIVEKNTKIKVKKMIIVYLSENESNYILIEVPYLHEEVKKILESRRVRKMKSIPVLLIGASGTGKSASLRNFKKEEIAIANVLGKPLPFKTNIDAPKVDDYSTILRAIQHTDKKTIVIDDAGYLLTNEFMSKTSVKGYDKYNEMAQNFWNLINGIKNIEGGKTVYLIMHEDGDENGNVKPKTIGKLLDDKVNIQGIFTICLRSMYKDGNYIFRLKTNGQDCVKTPIGLFEEDEMENDLKVVDNKIREYYELDKGDN